MSLHCDSETEWTINNINNQPEQGLFSNDISTAISVGFSFKQKL